MHSLLYKFCPSASSDTIANNQVQKIKGHQNCKTIPDEWGEARELALKFSTGRKETKSKGNKRASAQSHSWHASPTDL